MFDHTEMLEIPAHIRSYIYVTVMFVSAVVMLLYVYDVYLLATGGECLMIKGTNIREDL